MCIDCVNENKKTKSKCENKKWNRNNNKQYPNQNIQTNILFFACNIFMTSNTISKSSKCFVSTEMKHTKDSIPNIICCQPVRVECDWLASLYLYIQVCMFKYIDEHSSPRASCFAWWARIRYGNCDKTGMGFGIEADRPPLSSVQVSSSAPVPFADGSDSRATATAVGPRAARKGPGGEGELPCPVCRRPSHKP